MAFVIVDVAGIADNWDETDAFGYGTIWDAGNTQWDEGRTTWDDSWEDATEPTDSWSKRV